MPELDAAAKAQLDREVIKPAFFAYLDIAGEQMRATTAGHEVSFFGEVVRTNYLHNSAAAGAVAGTPGSIPNWSFINPAGGQRQIVGFGIDADGIEYVDVRAWGTATAATGLYIMPTANSTGLQLGAVGEAWTAAVDVQLIAGTIPPGGSIFLYIRELNAGFGMTAQSSDPNFITTVGQKLRRKHTRIISEATTTRLVPIQYTAIPNGSVFDFTLRVRRWQFERSTVQTDYIRTSAGPITITTPGQTGDPDLDGHTFTSLDPTFVNIGDVKHQEGGSDTLTCTLSGLILPDSDLLNIIANPANWRLRKARLWMLVRDENGTAQGGIVPYYTGYMIALDIMPSPQGQVIQLKIENYLALLTRASNRNYLSQSEFDPGDLSAQATIGGGNNSSGPAARVSTGGGNRVGGGAHGENRRLRER